MSTSSSEYLYCDHEIEDSEYSHTDSDSSSMDPPLYTNLQDFVKTVYQLSDNELESITSSASSKTSQLLDSNISISISISISEYQQAIRVEDANPPSGEMMSTAFRRIMEDLFVKLRADGHDLSVSIESVERTKLSTRRGVSESHGFFFGGGTVDTPVRWSTCKAFLELRISSDRRQVTAETLPAESSCSSDRSAATRIDVSPTVPQTPNSPLGTKRKLGNLDEQNDPPSRKRYRYDLSTRKRKKEPPQAAGIALELMSSTCRRWVTGLVVEDTYVWAQYYDRMGAVYAEPFDFVNEPTKLAVLALAIGKCGLVEAGFEPYLTADIGAVATRPLPSLGSAEFLIPRAGGQERQGIEVIQGIPDECYSHFKITDNASYTYSAVGGRGTHVLPGYLVNEQGVLHGVNTLVDETKTVADRPPDTDTSKDATRPNLPPKAMVAKLSWPAASRPRLEAETLISLHERIPWMRHHLPLVHCAVTLKGEAIHLPRHLFRDMTTTHKLEQRYFTFLFTERYRHLWEVPTLMDFQLAYIDVVECHYAATRYGKVLHRDISENNLLWTRGAKRVVGVLNDWDLATPVDAIRNSATHPTGTGPFMALDLLSKEPPAHLYRHDLESLFYVLIWAAVHYNIGDTVPYSHIVDVELEKWDGTYEEALSAKILFLSDTERVLKRIRPSMKPLRAIWIKPLCELFQKSRANARILRAAQVEPEVVVVDSVLRAAQGAKLMKGRNDGSDSESDDEHEHMAPPPEPAAPAGAPVNIDFETLGCLTFESFMAALDGWKPRRIPKKHREQAKQHLAAE